jgi:hypothetical protein
MGKITLNANPRRISHPPHMPRYRMAPRDKVAQLLKALKHKLGGSVCRGSDLKPMTTPGWFQQRRAMKRTITKVSSNRLVLIDNGCRHETQRHWFHHRNCGNNLFLSPELILKAGPDNVCVYCQGATDMKACGTASLLQKFVYEHSGQKVMTTQQQSLRDTEDEYAFYCIIHRESFFTSFKHFLETASITNGCPQCAGESSFWAETAPVSITQKP